MEATYLKYMPTLKSSDSEERLSIQSQNQERQELSLTVPCCQGLLGRGRPVTFKSSSVKDTDNPICSEDRFSFLPTP